MDEKRFLDEAALTYQTDITGISKWNIDSYIRIYKEYIPSFKKGLELGVGSSGYSIKRLLQIVDKLDVVDGSKRMMDRLPEDIKNLRNVKFIYSLFEEIKFIEEYDVIFCSYILEHVKDVKEILDICFNALKKGGYCLITVPNARAFSRQMAKEMGIISDLYALTDNDKAHGHRRVFDMEKLQNVIECSQFKLIKIGGTFFKPFADFQMNKIITNNIINEEQLIGLQNMAEKYPDLCGSIYAVCEKN